MSESMAAQSSCTYATSTASPTYSGWMTNAVSAKCSAEVSICADVVDSSVKKEVYVPHEALNISTGVIKNCKGVNENDVSIDAKNVVLASKGKILYFDPSMITPPKTVLPDVESVRVVNESVVIVNFKDGTTEKAVLSAADTFDLEYGISICVTKRLFAELTGGSGTSVYNKVVKHIVRVYDKAEREAVKKKAKEIAEKKRIENAEKKKAAKRAKRLAAIREREIETQKEAIIRAVKTLQNGNTDGPLLSDVQ